MKDFSLEIPPKAPHSFHVFNERKGGDPMSSDFDMCHKASDAALRGSSLR